MIDIDKIGKRIKEQRKYMRKVSQEKMAEDLGMYQADISNLEKAKSGSGISDLYKLDAIAEYLNIPLETLLFGREDKNMLKYHGDTMRLAPSKKKLIKTHEEILKTLTGQDPLPEPITWECGPYTLYSMYEYQLQFDNESEVVDGKPQPTAALPKLHTYVFFGMEIIGVMTTSIATVMAHVYQPALNKLQGMIPFDVLDVTDVWRTLNPYWALWKFSEPGPENDAYYDKMFKRMDELRSLGEDRKVLYIESIYVREDCRRNGIFRMYIDFLKEMAPDSIMWLNMEPTSGAELEEEYLQVPVYSVSELGQLNMNAAIAEKVGFTVDPDTWHRQAEIIAADGNVTTEVVLVRKCAYYLPQAIRDLLKDDGNLVEVGRAMQKVTQKDAEPQTGIDMNTYEKDGWKVAEWKDTYVSGPEIGKTDVWYVAYALDGSNSWRFGYSNRSPQAAGIDHEGQYECYEWLDDAEGSEQIDTWIMLQDMLISSMPEDMLNAIYGEDEDEAEED